MREIDRERKRERERERERGGGGGRKREIERNMHKTIQKDNLLTCFCIRALKKDSDITI